MPASSTRRDFLRSAGVLAAAASGAAARPAPAQTRTGEDYWEAVRGRFAFTERMVPMNAANLCPSFREVAEGVRLLTEDIDIDCSFGNRAKFADMLERTRRRTAAQLNVDADEIALVRNTSEANNIINNGLPLGAGDEVLVWDQNHPTNNVAWDVRAARFGFSVSRIATPSSPAGGQQLVDAFVSRFTRRTRALALTHVSNVSGVRLPVAEIAAAARPRGIHVHVDGAQTWGAMALDLRALDVDSYSASAHKWYMGPKEVGLLYVRERNIERIWPGGVAPGWGPEPGTALAGARKFESLGQRDDAALAALDIAARIHDEIGPERIEARVVWLAGRLKRTLADAGLPLVSPMDPALSLGVCIAAAPADRRRRIVDRLYSEHGIAGAATGGVRLSPTIYNTAEHVDRAAAALKAMMA